jgi:hypothetical protein
LPAPRDNHFIVTGRNFAILGAQGTGTVRNRWRPNGS